MAIIYLPHQAYFFTWTQSSVLNIPIIKANAKRAEAYVRLHDQISLINGYAITLDRFLLSLPTLLPSKDDESMVTLRPWIEAGHWALIMQREGQIRPRFHRNAAIALTWHVVPRDSASQSTWQRLLTQIGTLHLPGLSNPLDVPWSPETLLQWYVDDLATAIQQQQLGLPRQHIAQFYPAPVPDQLALNHSSHKHSITSSQSNISLTQHGLNLGFRLALPTKEPDLPDSHLFTLQFVLQSKEDPSLIVTAESFWEMKKKDLWQLDPNFQHAHQQLRNKLTQASAIFSPLARALVEAKPTQMSLSPYLAHQFVTKAAVPLQAQEFPVWFPEEMTSLGQQRIRLRMRVSGSSTYFNPNGKGTGLRLNDLLDVEWEALIGEQSISLETLERIAAQKVNLIYENGHWIAFEPNDLHHIRSCLKAKNRQITVRDALHVALTEQDETGDNPLSPQLIAHGTFADLLETIKQNNPQAIAPPKQLLATLRPYQVRGFQWLVTMQNIGFGACLADDMGLGKTVQWIALLLHHFTCHPRGKKPSLLVVPTSVLGSWHKEIARFAPQLDVILHYGPSRLTDAAQIPKRSKTIILTSYGMLRQDLALWKKIEWQTFTLDEAQHIKNEQTLQRRAAVQISSMQRFALTGTPVENNLTELWSIFDFLNPGLLGSINTFQNQFATPIEKYKDEETAKTLQQIVRPFLLRRVKSDQTIIQDLPDKIETEMNCSLTKEQITLYRAVVKKEMEYIEVTAGMRRKGRILALLTALKQICNYPGLYLKEAEPIRHDRSGKMLCLIDLVSQILAAKDKVLIFSQFSHWGDKLQVYLKHYFNCDVFFLCGKTSRRQRDVLVESFQSTPHPAIFVLSLKAGGTGLNLTAANHVIHYDRWWNPAVELQASDRAYRIGQKRNVHVHTFFCKGTLEEKIAQMLQEKRQLVSQIISAKETWITQMDNHELRDLFSLTEFAA